MEDMTSAQVCVMLNLSIDQLKRNTFLQSIKIKNSKGSGNGFHWLKADIDKYIEDMRVKQMDDSSKDKNFKKYSMDLFTEKILPQFIRFNFERDELMYRVDLNTNEWAYCHKEFLFDLSKVYDEEDGTYLNKLERIYFELINQKKSHFLLTPAEIETGIIRPLAQKMAGVEKFCRSHPDYVITDIKQFTNDISTVALKYFNISDVDDIPTPIMDIFESQMADDDIDTFRAFIYSIFNDKNNYRQLLWLYDGGLSGKSLVCKGLGLFGGKHFMSSVKAEQITDKHWGTYFDGYRYILFDDNTDPFLISRSVIRTITGGGMISVDAKSSMKVDAITNNKLIVTANIVPIITDAKADLSRLILIKINSPDPKNIAFLESFEDLSIEISKELKSYIKKCKEPYNKLCPNNNRIELNERQIRLIETCQGMEVSMRNNFIDSYFTFKQDGILSKKLLLRCIDHYDDGKVCYDKLLQYLMSRGVSTERYEDNNTISQRYRGICLNNKWEFKNDMLQIKNNNTTNESNSINID